MAINNQIEDEKLQHDINRKAGKISALSSGKINKYEYLTAEEVLASNQKQIMEKAKFTYSPIGKTFEKQITTIEDNGKKQVEALKDLTPKKLEAIRDNKFSIHKEVFNELSNERISEINNISKEIDFNNLTYYFKGQAIPPINFIGFRGPLNIYKEIKNGNITLEKIEENQENLRSKLSEINTENPKHRSKDQLDAIKNIKNLYNSREKVIQLYNDYAKIMSEAVHKTKSGAELKILTPKQMLQTLPIGLAQVKTGNNSESLLNEIRQIVYSLYQSKEITKKVHNNIIKSIQL